MESVKLFEEFYSCDEASKRLLESYGDSEVINDDTILKGKKHALEIGVQKGLIRSYHLENIDDGFMDMYFVIEHDFELLSRTYGVEGHHMLPHYGSNKQSNLKGRDYYPFFKMLLDFKPFKELLNEGLYVYEMRWMGADTFTPSLLKFFRTSVIKPIDGERKGHICHQLKRPRF